MNEFMNEDELIVAYEDHGCNWELQTVVNGRANQITVLLARDTVGQSQARREPRWGPGQIILGPHLIIYNSILP